jgi:penicillin-binding protein 2
MHIGVIALLLFFALNFWYLQVVRGDNYARLAENNRLRRVVLPPTRGVIRDREGRVVASTRPSLNLVLTRESRGDVDIQLRRLAPILGVPYVELKERHNRMRGRPLFEPMVLKVDVSMDILARVESRREKFPSVEVRQIARRSYPEGDVVSHPLGYVGEVSISQLTAGGEGPGIASGDIVGKAGVEKGKDEILRGERGVTFVSVNNLGRRIGEGRMGQPAVAGKDLGVVVDLDLQRTLMEAFGDEVGGAVFMDPWTGEILAMGSTPSYDPNDFADGISREVWEAIQSDPRRPMHNRAIASFYAPGSTFKVLVAIAGLESGAITPEERVFCNGSTRIYGSTRLCWKRGGHGWVDLRQALAHSCNVYFYKAGQKMGIEPIHKYGAMFNLGKTRGLDIPGEAGGILPSDAWKRQARGERWYPGDTISVAIGQGLLAVTPLQMATLMAGVGTKGSLPYPRLTAKGEKAPSKVQVSQRTFDLIHEALADVVTEGTARRAQVEGYTVAGKTGTAQVYKMSAGIDADKMDKATRDHAWFAGYAPADNPRIAFAVVVEHGGHGGTTAAPIARKVLKTFFAKERQGVPSPPVDQAGRGRERRERGGSYATSSR